MDLKIIKLSQFMEYLKGYVCIAEKGFARTDGTPIYISPRTLDQFLMYVLILNLGNFLQLQIEDDVEDEQEPERVNAMSEFVIPLDTEEEAEEEIEAGFNILGIANIRTELEKMQKYGIMYNTNIGYSPVRPLLAICYEELTTGNEEQELIEVIEAYREEVADFGYQNSSPEYLYIGKIDYLVYDKLLKVIGKKFGTTLTYHNLEEFNKYRHILETEQRLMQFTHITDSIPKDQIYNFTVSSPLVGSFANKVSADPNASATDFRRRSTKQKVFQIRDLYDFVKASECKVFTFGLDLTAYDVDLSFYVALSIAQQTKDIKVLHTAPGYIDQLKSLVNLQYGDFLHRLSVMLELTKPGTLRVTVEKNGKAAIVYVKDRAPNLKFSGMNINAVKKLIVSKNGGYGINLPTMLTDFPDIDKLGTIEFAKYTDAGYTIQPINPLTVILNMVKFPLDENGMVGEEYEDYVYNVCRLIDQVCNRYKKFTTIRDLAAFVIHDKSGKTKDAYYIGYGSIQPEIRCDTLVLNHEGILLKDQKYQGDLLDAEWIDDLKSLQFYLSADENTRVNFLDKVRSIYKNAGERVPEPLENYVPQPYEIPGKGKFQPVIEFMQMVYGASRATPMEFTRDIESFVQQPHYRINSNTDPLMFHNPLALIYYKIALNYNYTGYTTLLPRFLESMTVYGFRKIPHKESPVNIYGGPNLDINSNLWVYPELFQRHERSRGDVTGEFDTD